MSRPVANVNILSDTFEGLVLSVNQLLNSLSTEVITANSTVANTGNTAVPRTSQLFGTFGANTVVITNGIRGGNVNGLTSTLIVSSNVTVNTDAGNILSVGNSTVNSVANSTTLKVSNSTVNLTITSSSVLAGNLVANTTAVAVGANAIVNTSAVFVGNSTVNAVATSTLLRVANSTQSVNVATGTVAIGNSTTAIVANSTAITGNVSFTNATSFANTVTVTGTLAGSNTLTVTGNTTFSNIVTFKTELVVDVYSNTDLSATMTPVLLYSFPKASYSTAKLMVQVKKGTNTQISEILVAHDGTTAYATTYGVVVSPTRAGQSTFSANINSANVEILITQEYASSAGKVVAHLIK